MDNSVVVVLPCNTYDEEQVYSCMNSGIRMLGGICRFESPEESILVKPNFLSVSEADKAVVTHPSVISGMLRILNSAGSLRPLRHMRQPLPRARQSRGLSAIDSSDIIAIKKPL